MCFEKETYSCSPPDTAHRCHPGNVDDICGCGAWFGWMAWKVLLDWSKHWFLELVLEQPAWNHQVAELESKMLRVHLLWICLLFVWIFNIPSFIRDSLVREYLNSACSLAIQKDSVRREGTSGTVQIGHTRRCAWWYNKSWRSISICMELLRGFWHCLVFVHPSILWVEDSYSNSPSVALLWYF